MLDRPRLIFLLNSAQRHLQQWMAAQHARLVAAQGSAPTAAQSGVLFCLAQTDGLTMGELAQTLDLAPSAMSGLIQRMEVAGWLQRQPCPNDARTQRVRLLPAGQHLMPALTASLASVNTQLSAGFTPEELQVVARWLRHVQQLPTPSL